MKWIRIEVTIGDDALIGAVAEAIRVPLAEAVGLCTLVFAKLPAHAKDGNLSEVRDITLEGWAKWRGKPGVFATAFRAHLCSDEGVVLEWERINGAAIRESEATAERVRTLRANRKNPPVETTIVPAFNVNEPPITTLKKLNTTARVRRTAPVHSPTDVDVDGTAKQPPVANTERREGESEPRGNVEKPARPTGILTATATPSSVVNRFTAKFYARSGPERRMEVAKQMAGAMLSTGVEFEGKTVKAVDEDHLDEACLAVMEEPPRESNAAWVHVLRHLRDTRLEVLSARAKALVSEKRAPLPPGMAGDAPAGATPLRGAIANVLEGLEETVPRETGGDDGSNEA